MSRTTRSSSGRDESLNVQPTTSCNRVHRQQPPTNHLVRALLTDLYQITMTYAHWKTGTVDEKAVFELFFRKNPFGGEYTVFCGLDECLKLIRTFRFESDDLDYLKTIPSLASAPDAFWDYLGALHETSLTKLTVKSVPEGTVVFPHCPLLVLEGPLGLGHLLETALLNLVNYPSLVATNASRMVLRAGQHKTKDTPCIEFGLRRAQGPDGACSASKYSYLGGFVATSNLQAGKTFGIPVSGTHAHSYIQSFASLDDAAGLTLFHKSLQRDENFMDAVLEHRSRPGHEARTNDGELAAFCAYACAFPDACLCLVDTYDTLASGLPNFVLVAKVLDDFGYRPLGIRLDSGDLAALSMACRDAFETVAEEEPSRGPAFGSLAIVASNDINETKLIALSEQDHGVTAFGIGTNLVTCQAQPALGCVYKLVEFRNEPRIKLSQDLEKMTLPGRKRAYRLYGGPNNRVPLIDYLCLADEDPTQTCCEETNKRGVLCRNPFRPQERIRVFPGRVKDLHQLVFDGSSYESDDCKSECDYECPSLSETRNYVLEQLRKEFPETVTRYERPTPHNVMVSQKLYNNLHELWEKNAPIPERR
eukprot:jgi/Psemu1/256893/estExt_Genewise1Plus.C_2000023